MPALSWCQSCSHPLETRCPQCPMEWVAAAPGGINHCSYLGQLLVLPCRPGFPRGPFCLCFLYPIPVPGPQVLRLVPLLRQLPDALWSTET